MSDNHRVYRTIKQAIMQLYPGEPKGNTARMLTTLAALVSGIVLGKSCQLPTIARPGMSVHLYLRYWRRQDRQSGR